MLLNGYPIKLIMVVQMSSSKLSAYRLAALINTLFLVVKYWIDPIDFPYRSYIFEPNMFSGSRTTPDMMAQRGLGRVATQILTALT
jgi:hypothetical protein